MCCLYMHSPPPLRVHVKYDSQKRRKLVPMKVAIYLFYDPVRTTKASLVDRSSIVLVNDIIGRGIV